MRIALLLVAAAVTAHAQLCTLEGKVVNDSNGQPISKATLFLRSAANNVYSTHSGDKGQFGFAGIEAGSYTLTAERVGYVTGGYGSKRPSAPAKTFALEASRKATGMDVRLMSAGAISGRVMLTDGQPVAGASVSLLHAKYVDGQKQLVEIGGARVQDRSILSPTNDLGEFHIPSLEPGRYYLRVDMNASSTIRLSSGNVRVQGRILETVPTYFPAAIEMRNAQPIDVVSGRTAPGIAVTLVEMPLETIRGRLENAPTAAGVNVNVVLCSPGGQIGTLARDSQTGELEGAAAIAPGHYVAMALTFNSPGSSGTPGRLRYDFIPVDLAGGTVTVALHSLTALTGVVRADEGPALNLRQVRVALRPAAFLASMPPQLMPTQSPAADGKLNFSDIPADRYTVEVSGLPEGVYVQGMKLGDAAIVNGTLDLTKGNAGTLEIQLSRTSGTVEGIVTDAQGKPVDGATVVLIPVQGRDYRTAITDDAGKYKLTAPPGRYRVYAWTEVEDGAWTDAEFLRPVASKAPVAIVSEGGGSKVDLSTIQ